MKRLLMPGLVAVLALLVPAQCLAIQVTLVSVDGKRPVLVLPNYAHYCDYVNEVLGAPNLDAAEQIATQPPYNAVRIQPGSVVEEVKTIAVDCNGGKLKLIQVMPPSGAGWRGIDATLRALQGPGYIHPGFVPPDAIKS
jgi:hypothetical protein